jgi:regulator of nucleoside diphosphate kinase
MLTRSSSRRRESARHDANILDAAERVFQRKPYRQATMEEIARETGMSVGGLYNVFADKQDLYTQVIERSGESLIARTEQALRTYRQPSEALHQLVRLRLYNYVRDRLFFNTFAYPHELGVEPDPTNLDPRVVELYHHYLETMERQIRTVAGDVARVKHIAKGDYRSALSLEGLITAFMGYWAGPRQSDSLVAAAHEIVEILLRGVGKAGASAAATPPADEPASRDIHISTFDMERLREVLEVARAFGGAHGQAYLDILASELAHAHMVHSRDVPPDLITMNSRVRLRNLDTAQESVYALVFPKDADAREENVSVLSPLGTALLGFRVGDTITPPAPQRAPSYLVLEILYQPEAAGDFHL